MLLHPEMGYPSSAEYSDDPYPFLKPGSDSGSLASNLRVKNPQPLLPRTQASSGLRPPPLRHRGLTPKRSWQKPHAAGAVAWSRVCQCGHIYLVSDARVMAGRRQGAWRRCPVRPHFWA